MKQAIGISGTWSLDDVKRIRESDPGGLLSFIPPKEVAALFDAFATEPLRGIDAWQKQHVRQWKGIVPVGFVEETGQERRQAHNKRKAARRKQR